ncbi:Mov34/MPN/PAD-1 family protein [Aurantiacibacter suaedae]|uniref:Mov34/MPN/PAD-1 family protein n=1 Tax=Aurantiacibacter suaedae TaxID=2545755 RepID=UPI0010F5190B|nr:M67 family metallopeptidase [Aurantiacibacter suaedae]
MSPSREKSSPSTSSGQSDVVLADAAAEQIRSHARLAAPLECCGLLLGQAGAITEARPARNVHLSPQTHFEIDPQALIDAHRAARAGGPQVLGYYHSHPRGPAEPSATDRAMAAHDRAIWAIVGQDGAIGLWSDNKQGFEALFTQASSR